jgi:CRP/FNR family transcriptional regulator, polysaccharide utilization system transcription regulator
MGFSKKDAPNCEWCPVRKDCFYGLLDRRSKRAWIEMRVASPFKQDDIVFFDGEKPTGVYVLCTGQAKIYKSTRTGQQLITRIVKPASLMGYRTVLAEQNYSGTAMSMQDSVVSLIETDRFNQFLEFHPNATHALLKKLARDLGTSENQTRDIAYKSAKARLSDVLLKLMKPSTTAKGKPMVEGIKRKEIAEMAGLTIETTVRLLNDFEKQGIVKRGERTVEILDEEKIRQIAGAAA